MKRLLTAALVAAAALLLPGCGKSDRLATYAVTGKAHFGTTPATGATVVFHPATPLPEGVGKPRATVQADGTYKLTTYETNDGAPEGDYKVTVEWWLSPGGDAAATNRLAARYGKPESSGIEARVGKQPTAGPAIVLNP